MAALEIATRARITHSPDQLSPLVYPGGAALLYVLAYGAQDAGRDVPQSGNHSEESDDYLAGLDRVTQCCMLSDPGFMISAEKRETIERVLKEYRLSLSSEITAIQPLVWAGELPAAAREYEIERWHEDDDDRSLT